MKFYREQQYTVWLCDYKSRHKAGQSQIRINQASTEDIHGRRTAYD